MQHKFKQNKIVQIIIGVFLILLCVGSMKLFRLIEGFEDWPIYPLIVAGIYFTVQSLLATNQTVSIDSSGLKISINKNTYDIPWNMVKQVNFQSVPMPFLPLIFYIYEEGIGIVFKNPDNYDISIKPTIPSDMIRINKNSGNEDNANLIIRTGKKNTKLLMEEIGKWVGIRDCLKSKSSPQR